MQEHRLARYAPLAGVVWVVALIATVIWVGDTPDTDSSTAKVVAYWAKNDGKQIAGSIIGAVAMVFFVWFAGSLRAALRTAEGAAGRLSAISYGGALLFAAGGIMSLSFNFAVADTVGDVPPTVTQSLFILNDDVWLWAPVGTALLLAPAAVLAFRTGFVPRWLAWLTAIIAVACLTPGGFFGVVAAQLWIFGVAIMLFRRNSAAGAPPPAAAPASAP